MSEWNIIHEQERERERERGGDKERERESTRRCFLPVSTSCPKQCLLLQYNPRVTSLERWKSSVWTRAHFQALNQLLSKRIYYSNHQQKGGAKNYTSWCLPSVQHPDASASPQAGLPSGSDASRPLLPWWSPRYALSWPPQGHCLSHHNWPGWNTDSINLSCQLPQLTRLKHKQYQSIMSVTTIDQAETQTVSIYHVSYHNWPGWNTDSINLSCQLPQLTRLKHRQYHVSYHNWLGWNRDSIISQS